MYALLILDIQVGLIHGPEKPWRCDELLETLNTLMDKARSAGAPIFLARHIGPAGSPIEPGSALTQVAQELKLLGGEVVFEKRRPNAFAMTGLADNLRSSGATGVVVSQFTLHDGVSVPLPSTALRTLPLACALTVAP